MRSERLCMWSMILVGFVTALLLFILSGVFRETDRFMFSVFKNTGPFFSFLLVFVFLAGILILIDRFFFWIFFDVSGVRMNMPTAGAEKKSKQCFFDSILRNSLDLKDASKEGMITDDIVDNARQSAIDAVFDGQEPDQGRTWLELLGALAPTIGFMGTLVGLMSAFRVLGRGGELRSVLGGLGISMTTSLLGAMISVVFLTGAWMLGAQRAWLDNRVEKVISDALETNK